MFGFSTAWISENLGNEDDLLRILKELGDLGIKYLELEYRIPELLFLKLRPKLKGKVISVHNFFPFPEGYSHLKPSGDLFLLSSLDKEEREKAVKYTIKTIQNAHDLECSVVVLHLGKVEMESYYQQFCHYFDSNLINSPEMDLFFSRLKEERKSKQHPYLDAVFFSLEKLNQEAEKRGVCLGMENRYYFQEIPNFEEIGLILKKFTGGKIFYWHDVGHGHVQERLGMQSHRKLLEAYFHYIVGVHLHDANGYTDHDAPGKGEVDFKWIKGYLKEETLKVLELHPRTSFEEAKKSFSFLQSLGYQ